MSIPVVIAANGRGIPVTQTTRGAPMTIAANGRGFPVVVVPSGGAPVNIDNLPPPPP